MTSSSTGPMYNSPHFKEKVAAHELKLKLRVNEILQDMEQNHLREFERSRYACQLKCHEIMTTATVSSKTVRECVRNCDLDFQRGTIMAHEELELFTRRLASHMNDCQQQAQNVIPKGFEYDPRKIHKSEVVFLNCLQRIGNDHLSYLGIMRKRIMEELQNIMPTK